MALSMTKGGKIGITIVFLAAAIALYKFVLKPTVFAEKVQASKTIEQVDLPTAPENAAATIGKLTIPSSQPVPNANAALKMLVLPWNAQMGVMFANGGNITTVGSIVHKYGLALNIERQDDYAIMKSELIKFAEDYKNNPNGPWEGSQYVTIMGDAYPFFIYGLNKNLEKLGPEFRAEVIASVGKSNGEDKFMVPPGVKENPADSLKGLVCAAVVLDGDWNVAVQYAASNNVAINPDVTTYDPNALNFYGTSSFTEAANAYINQVTEKRPVVKNGKLTGEKVTITVRSCAVWTPADVTVVENRGGLVTAASTFDYASQMPCTIIGIRKFNSDHTEQTKNIIRAFCEGGDMVKAYSEALKKGGEISAKVYKENNTGYWVKYYKGASATDMETGDNVQCGGSAVFNLADNFNYFGIAEGQRNIYRSIYNIFGSIDTLYYPDQIPTYPKFETVVNLNYLRAIYEDLQGSGTEIASASTTTYNATSSNTETVSKQSVTINFESGSANFKADAIQTLEKIYAQSINAINLYITIEGHTDATGTQSQNEILANQRALAVKKWLQQKDPANFPDSRFISVEGYADQSTRRVDIVLSRSK